MEEVAVVAVAVLGAEGEVLPVGDGVGAPRGGEVEEDLEVAAVEEAEAAVAEVVVEPDKLLLSPIVTLAFLSQGAKRTLWSP